MTTELLLSFSNILAAHILSQAALLPPNKCTHGRANSKEHKQLKVESVLLAMRCQLSLEASSEFVVRIFLRKASLQKGYKRNEAQGSNSSVFTNAVYATFYCKTG